MIATRRQYLAAVGTVGILGVAGCSSGDDGSDNGDESPDDGDGTHTDGTNTETTQSPSTGSTTVELTPWMTLHADPERTRSTPDRVPANLSEVAEGGAPPIPTGGAERNFFTLVTSDGVFHLGDSKIAGFERSNLDQKFLREFGGTLGAGKDFEGYNIIPGYIENGTLVAGINDTLLGLSVDDGSREWIVDRSGIPFPTGDGIGLLGNSQLSVFEGGSQAVRWEKSVAGLDQIPPVHTESGTVFLRTETLSAFDVGTGDQQWSRSLSGEGSTPFAVHGETLYVINDERTLALDRTDGSTQWEYGGVSKGVLGRIPTYAVDEDGVYFSWGDGILALDPSDGSELWSTPTTTSVFGLAAGAENLAYKTENRLRVLSKANGESQAAADVEGPNGQFAIAGGRIYVRQDAIGNRKLIAFGSG